MKNYAEVEVFYIEEPNENNEMFAWISFKDPEYKREAKSLLKSFTHK